MRSYSLSHFFSFPIFFFFIFSYFLVFFLPISSYLSYLYNFFCLPSAYIYLVYIFFPFFSFLFFLFILFYFSSSLSIYLPYLCFSMPIHLPSSFLPLFFRFNSCIIFVVPPPPFSSLLFLSCHSFLLFDT